MRQSNCPGHRGQFRLKLLKTGFRRSVFGGLSMEVMYGSGQGPTLMKGYDTRQNSMFWLLKRPRDYSFVLRMYHRILRTGHQA